MVWNELYTTDLETCSTFYTGLFGWTTKTMETPDGDYLIIMNGDRANGGMLAIGEDWSEVPPSWGVYFAVADCDATLAKAPEEGGALIWGPRDAPGIGRFANVRDPQGAHFSVIKLENPD